jgi:hypothetical protein
MNGIKQFGRSTIFVAEPLTFRACPFQNKPALSRQAAARFGPVDLLEPEIAENIGDSNGTC